MRLRRGGVWATLRSIMSGHSHFWTSQQSEPVKPALQSWLQAASNDWRRSEHHRRQFEEQFDDGVQSLQVHQKAEYYRHLDQPQPP